MEIMEKITLQGECGFDATRGLAEFSKVSVGVRLPNGKREWTECQAFGELRNALTHFRRGDKITLTGYLLQVERTNELTGKTWNPRVLRVESIESTVKTNTPIIRKKVVG